MKPDNPFRDWLTSNPYGGTWVPVAGLGGYTGPASIPVLFPRGAKDDMLAGADWPLQYSDAGPEVFYSYTEGVKEHQAILHPEHHLGEMSIEHLAVAFEPPDRRSWIEPVQGFVLFWGASPHLGRDGQIDWEVPDEDGKPEIIATWSRTPQTEYEGVLRIRRDKLLNFLAVFDLGLAIYFEENIADDSVPGEWRDDEREPLRYWRCWASAGFTEHTRVVLRCVTVIEAPAREDEDEDRYSTSSLDYVIGSDPVTGKPVTASFPGPTLEETTWEGAGRDNFLTPVLFKRDVLDYYLDDPKHYSVDNQQVTAGHMWGIPIAITKSGHVQVWLGDLGRIPKSAQEHWKRFNIADDDPVPEWRIEQDLHAKFARPPESEPLDRLRRAIRDCDEAAQRYCGEKLFADVDGLSGDRVRNIRVPRNGSMPAFQDEVMSLAILLVEHLNAQFFVKAGVGKGGSLERLTAWLRNATGKTDADAKDVIAGLFAIQAIRSKAGGAHRGGSSGIEALGRAELEPEDLAAGFERLVLGAITSVEELTTILKESAPVTPQG